MAFGLEALWKTLKTKGPKLATIGLASALIFAVANKLADNALTSVVDDISAFVKPPTFLIVFSEATDARNLQLERDDRKPVSGIKVVPLGDRAVEGSVAPGNYLLKLHRDKSASREVLNVPVALRTAGASLPVDVSHWAPEEGASHFEGTNPTGAPNLIGTRWVTAQVGWDGTKTD